MGAPGKSTLGWSVEKHCCTKNTNRFFTNWKEFEEKLLEIWTHWTHWKLKVPYTPLLSCFVNPIVNHFVSCELNIFHWQLAFDFVCSIILCWKRWEKYCHITFMNAIALLQLIFEKLNVVKVCSLYIHRIEKNACMNGIWQLSNCKCNLAWI